MGKDSLMETVTKCTNFPLISIMLYAMYLKHYKRAQKKKVTLQKIFLYFPYLQQKYSNCTSLSQLPSFKLLLHHRLFLNCHGVFQDPLCIAYRGTISLVEGSCYAIGPLGLTQNRQLYEPKFPKRSSDGVTKFHVNTLADA